MPYNRTRIWVGLAIAAVTIPAVGQYVVRSGTSDDQAHAALQEVRWNATRTLGNTRNELRLANQNTVRDYLSEVNAAVGKQGRVFTGGKTLTYDDANEPASDAGYGDVSYDYDDPDGTIFDVDPLRADRGGDLIPSGTIAQALPPPDGTVEDAPTDDAQTTDVEAPPADDQGGLSDRDVYATVLNNLPPDDRDNFVRAWATMTSAQRAETLDDFRDRLEGNGN